MIKYISQYSENVSIKLNDLKKNEINCSQLNDNNTFKLRKSNWEQIFNSNGGTHPSVGDADTRLLNRMRNSAVSATNYYPYLPVAPRCLHL